MNFLHLVDSTEKKHSEPRRSLFLFLPAYLVPSFSQVPVDPVTVEWPIRPWRFSMSTCSVKHSVAFSPLLFLVRRASGSVVETRAALDLFSKRKFTSGLRLCPPEGGSDRGMSFLRRKDPLGEALLRVPSQAPVPGKQER